MINSTPTLEAHFHVVPRSFSRSETGGASSLRVHFPQGSLSRSAAALAHEALFALLDRLKLCHAPRIISAECFAGESVPSAGASRQE